MRGSNARIIDAAEPPVSPYKPNLLWNVLLGALAGLLAALLLVFLRGRFDRSFKAPGEVPFHLKLPELGVIPERDLAFSNGHAKPSGITMLPTMTQARELSQAGTVETVTWRDKSSIIAECFRGALTSVLTLVKMERHLG